MFFELKITSILIFTSFGWTSESEREAEGNLERDCSERKKQGRLEELECILGNVTACLQKIQRGGVMSVRNFFGGGGGRGFMVVALYLGGVMTGFRSDDDDDDQGKQRTVERTVTIVLLLITVGEGTSS